MKLKNEIYEAVLLEVNGLLDESPDSIAILSNVSALLNVHMDDINWVGFYIARGDQLVLGPFQGKPACMYIEKGRGVCGKTWIDQKTQVVYNVHDVPDHIACDKASNSEIVLPIIVNGVFFGVLDIDSPIVGRFNDDDLEGLEKIIELLSAVL